MTNVAVVVLDTLRYDYFKRHFEWLDGQWYTNAFSTSHWTIPAHASLFTGLYPSEAGIHAKSPSFDPEVEALPTRLQERGYRTRFFCGNGNIATWPGWDRGFTEFLKPRELDPRYEGTVDWDELDRKIDSTGMKRYLKGIYYCFAADAPTVRSLRHGYHRFRKSNAAGGGKAALARLRETDFQSNEFLLVNLMETHTPYHPPPGADDPVRVSIGQAFADNVTSPEHVRAAYDNSVRYLSEVYEEMYSLLRREFDYVITLADHGEMLGEHGMWNHGYGLYPELTRIPLVLSGPDVTEGTSGEPVSILDVHATVGALADVDIGGRGRSLLADDRPERDRLVEYHGFMDSHRDQFEREGAPLDIYDSRDEPLYGILTPSGEYGYQTHTDGTRFTGGAIKEFDDRLEEIRDSLDERRRSEVQIDDSVKDRLQKLGYA